MKDCFNRLTKRTLFVKGLSDTAYFTLAQAGSRLISLLVIPLLIRIITVEEFAQYDVFLLASSMLLTVLVVGFDSGSAIKISEKNDSEELLKFYLTSAIVTMFAMSIIIGTASILIVNTYFTAFISTKFWGYVLIYTLFWASQYLVFSFIRWRGEAKTAAFLLFIGSSLAYLLGFVLLYYSEEPTMFDFFNGLIIGNFIGTVVSFYFARDYISLELPQNYKSEYYDLMRLSLPFVGTGFSNQLLKSIDRIIIISLFSERELGLYALIVRVAQVPNFVLQLIGSGFQPVLLLNYKTNEGAALTKKVFETLTFCFMPILLISIFTSTFIIKTVGGEEYSEVAYLLPIVLSSVLIYGSTLFSGFGYFIKRKTIYITFIVIGIVISTYLLSHLLYFAGVRDLMIIGFSSLLSSVIGAYIYVYQSEKLYSFNYSLTKFSIVTLIALMLGLLGSLYLRGFWIE